MPRVLLLLPTTTYRAEAFLSAARELGVEVVVASERPSTLQEQFPENLLALDFLKPDVAAREVAELARRHSIDAVVPADDLTTVVGAAVAEALGLPANSVESAMATRNKAIMRELLVRAGVPSPAFTVLSVEEDPAARARLMTYPCVLKPLVLSASRGVIRADDPGEFLAAFHRIVAILKTPEVEALGHPARQILVEDFIPGQEVALEGLLIRGDLRVLALFDKPDPLDGPFFEETLYVTPSRLPSEVQTAIVDCTVRAARALGLREGPVHAELRVNDQGPWVIEIAARSIGGLCSKILSFGTGMSLEELILRHALRMPIPSLERDPEPAGVMMLPIPRRGVLTETRGTEAALAVPGMTEIAITAHPGQELVPLPEGWRYLGFLFARAGSPAEVEAALREAHRRLEFELAEAR